MDQFVFAGLGASLVLNAYLGFRFYKKDHILQKDAKAILNDLTKGKAILEVKVLDPSGLFYRSPRG